MIALAHERTGTGTPLVLVHGLGGELGAWEPVVGLLAERHEVICVDLPGHGASPPIPPQLRPSAAALAEEVAGFLSGLGIERAHAAGNSLGAWVALELGRQGHALSVTALCAAGMWMRPLGPPRARRPRALIRAALPLLPLLMRTEQGRARALGSVIGRPDLMSPAEALRLARNYATCPGYEECDAEMRRAVFQPEEPLGVPVTLAWGELDTLLGRVRRDGVPGARVVDLAGCAHIPMWDDPKQVARVILETTGAVAPTGSRSGDPV